MPYTVVVNVELHFDKEPTSKREVIEESVGEAIERQVQNIGITSEDEVANLERVVVGHWDWRVSYSLRDPASA